MKTFEKVMEITEGISSPTALDDAECRALYDAACEVPHGGLVVEIGCQLGRSSSILTQCATGKFRTVHIDPYTSQPELLKAWHEMMCSVGGDFSHSYTHLCMRTEQAEWHLKRLCADGIDLAFIDGDHEYPGVMTDLMMVAENIRFGGLLTMHDYGRDSLPGVYRAASEYITEASWHPVGTYGTLGVWRRRR